MAAGVDERVASENLEAMREANELLAVDRGDQRVYYPDPVTSYLAYTGPPTEQSDEQGSAATEARDAIYDWHSPDDLESVDELLTYHHAGRLVASSRLPRGRHAFDHDWDVLVVLDTCRVDAMQAVADRLPGATDSGVTSVLSPGSQTAEWLCHTFTTDRASTLETTGYVSGNGWTKAVFEDGLRPDDDVWFEGADLPTEWDVIDESALGAHVNAWQRDRGTYSQDVPWAPHPAPRTVTDHAIALSRERSDLDRLVVHYKQPHAPYTIAAEREGRNELTQAERAPFDFLQAGGNPDVVWDAYLTDLQATVDEIASLCRNVEGTVVVTADHGEAFGEFDDYGHRPAMLHPQVKFVPWVAVHGVDVGTRDGDLSAYRETDRDVDTQLEALGYR